MVVSFSVCVVEVCLLKHKHIRLELLVQRLDRPVIRPQLEIQVRQLHLERNLSGIVDVQAVIELRELGFELGVDLDDLLLVRSSHVGLVHIRGLLTECTPLLQWCQDSQAWTSNRPWVITSAKS